MTVRRPQPGEQGFTLLEILVALVVFGFLMAGLTQSVQFGLAAWRSQSQMIDNRSELDAVDRALRRLVERIAPGRPVDPPNIDGTAARLVFTSDLPAAATALASRHADMALEVDAAHRLVLRWTPHLHAVRLGPPPPPETTELLHGVDHVVLSYWTPAGGGGWRSAWRDRVPPTLIRIQIVFAPGDPRHWPDIVAAPMLGRADS